MTSPSHHLVSGNEIDIATAGAMNKTWIIDVIDADNFTLRNLGVDLTLNEIVVVGEADVEVDDRLVETLPAVGALVSKIIWASVLLTGTGGGFKQVLSDIVCTANGLVKTYAYSQ